MCVGGHINLDAAQVTLWVGGVFVVPAVIPFWDVYIHAMFLYQYYQTKLVADMVILCYRSTS